MKNIPAFYTPDLLFYQHSNLYKILPNMKKIHLIKFNHKQADKKKQYKIRNRIVSE